MDIDVIVGLIVFFVLMFLLFVVVLFCLLYQFVLDSVRQDFLKKLDDDYIACIKKYESTKPTFTQFCNHFKRGKKNG